jgi:hypothetical protein
MAVDIPEEQRLSDEDILFRMLNTSQTMRSSQSIPRNPDLHGCRARDDLNGDDLGHFCTHAEPGRVAPAARRAACGVNRSAEHGWAERAAISRCGRVRDAACACACEQCVPCCNELLNFRPELYF